MTVDIKFVLGRLYVAPVNTDKPNINADPPNAWTHIGNDDVARDSAVILRYERSTIEAGTQKSPLNRDSTVLEESLLSLIHI